MQSCFAYDRIPHSMSIRIVSLTVRRAWYLTGTVTTSGISRDITCWSVQSGAPPMHSSRCAPRHLCCCLATTRPVLGPLGQLASDKNYKVFRVHCRKCWFRTISRAVCVHAQRHRFDFGSGEGYGMTPLHTYLDGTSAPACFLQGFDPSLVGTKYGSRLYVWDWDTKALRQTLELGADGLIPLEIRFKHEPSAPDGFVGAALSSNVLHIHKVCHYWAATCVSVVQTYMLLIFRADVPQAPQVRVVKCVVTLSGHVHVVTPSEAGAGCCTSADGARAKRRNCYRVQGVTEQSCASPESGERQGVGGVHGDPPAMDQGGGLGAAGAAPADHGHPHLPGRPLPVLLQLAARRFVVCTQC